MSDDDREPDDDDPGLRSMRAVWLSMREEEPPTAGISALLAAAREQADAMRPKDSWWQRALVVLRRPPVLALASVVVLLGGAIALTMRGEDMTADAPPPATPSTIERSRAPAEAPTPNANPPAAVQPPAVAEERDHEKPETEATLKKDAQAPRPPSAHHAAPPPPRTIAQGTAAPGRFGGEGAPPQQAPPPPERPPVKEPATKTEGGLAIATDDRGADAAPEPKAPAADETIETTGNATRPQTSTAQLVQQCETAAARGDCAATRVTAAKIKKLDAAVYKARIQSNQTIARCLK